MSTGGLTKQVRIGPSIGNSGQGEHFDVSCPRGQILVGAELKASKKVYGITKLHCKEPWEILQRRPSNTIHTEIGGRQGLRNDFECPAGQAVVGAKAEYGDNIDRLGFFCRKFNVSSAGKNYTSPMFGAYSLYSNARKGSYETPNNFFSTGLVGKSGEELNSLGFKGKDFLRVLGTLDTDKGKIECCMGTSKGQCSMTPQSQACDDFMLKYCAEHPDEEVCACESSPLSSAALCFDPKCKEGFKNKTSYLNRLASAENCSAECGVAEERVGMGTTDIDKEAYDLACMKGQASMKQDKTCTRNQPLFLVLGLVAVAMFFMFVTKKK